MNNELSCQELVELVTDYLEGALSEMDKERFEAHVSVCYDCHSYFDQMRHTIRLIGRLSESALNPTVKDELLSLFRDWKKELPPADE
ncbi:MAG: zf-HC2 domain-containing protein [Chloroflexi bacterium]|nr:zf-HC2 domain-containing protein [Chloroflexota bacterium]